MSGLRYVCKYLSYIKWKLRLIKRRTPRGRGGGKKRKEDWKRLELPRQTLRCPRKYVTTQGVTRVARSGRTCITSPKRVLTNRSYGSWAVCTISHFNAYTGVICEGEPRTVGR